RRSAFLLRRAACLPRRHHIAVWHRQFRPASGGRTSLFFQPKRLPAFVCGSEQETDMINLTFPDGSVRPFEAGVTGKAIAEGISKSLAKKSVAMTLDGVLTD